VGKHTAADGDAAHPIVAEALASRPGGSSHAGGARADTESGPGWPAPPAPGGSGLGWPGDLTDAVSPASDRPA
jgi:hypothetical protein